MAGASGQNEAMPDSVVVRNFLTGEEHDTHRVQHSAGQQPKDSTEWNREKHRLDGKKSEPPHQNVHDRGQDR